MKMGVTRTTRTDSRGSTMTSSAHTHTAHTGGGPDHDNHGGHHDHGGHEGHGGGHGDHATMFRRRFQVTLLLTLPVLFYSEHLRGWTGLGHADPPGGWWVNPVLGTIIFLYGGWPFLTGGVAEARARRPGMMLLIAMAITVAYAASLAGALGAGDIDVWWELALLITIMLLGHWLEMRAIGQARGALAALADLLPDVAERVAGDGVESVPVGDLRVGDVVLVRPGGRVPADGRVVDGLAEVDESMVTGESRPVPRGAGDRVVAGTVATDSSLRVRVDAVGEETALAGIRRLVEEAQSSRSRAQALADRAAALLFYIALVSAAVTMVAWSAAGEPETAVVLGATVLIIACPHALGLAIPLVVSISTSLAARNGILVKDRLALERMRTVDAVLFDKTGTLTAGAHRVTAVHAADGEDAADVLAVAAAVEAESEHPLARAITAAAAERGEAPEATGFTTMAGRGVRATVAGHDVAVGGPSLLRELGIGTPESLRGAVDEAGERGASLLTVVRDGAVIGALRLEDTVRPESRAAVDALHAGGVRVVMITGDARPVAEAVGADLGIDEVFAEVLPADKDRAVAELQERGHVVAMVGDGVNDAPALARADVGIAIGAGTDVAIESAGVVLASDDPRAVLGVRRLSAAGYRKMVQNLWWAAGYNIAAIPLAAGVLAPIGFVLPMAVGAVLMSVSTIVVAINAQLLRRTDLTLGAAAGAARG
jgi:Cu2+-exporting ATPase